jgi:hypothetical protein
MSILLPEILTWAVAAGVAGAAALTLINSRRRHQAKPRQRSVLTFLWLSLSLVFLASSWLIHGAVAWVT